MRTIEEVREWAQMREFEETLPHLDACRQCIKDLLRFIDSEPPCRHMNRMFLHKNEWVTATFCPLCGEKLKE